MNDQSIIAISMDPRPYYEKLEKGLSRDIGITVITKIYSIHGLFNKSKHFSSM